MTVKQSAAQSRPALEAAVTGVHSGEVFAVTVILAAFLIVNLFTAARSPTVWQDEVQVADPAINLATGKGLTSTAHAYRPPDDRILPLNGMAYVLSLAGWLKAFGISPTAVRSLSHLFAAITGLLFWIAVIRAKLLTRPWARS